MRAGTFLRLSILAFLPLIGRLHFPIFAHQILPCGAIHWR